MAVISQYTDSTTHESNVSILAEAGNMQPPPPVLVPGVPWQNVIAGVSESDVLTAVQSVADASGGGLRPPPPVLVQFMQNNPDFTYAVADGS